MSTKRREQRLNDRQEQWVAAKSRGLTDVEAGKAAGYTASYAKVVSRRMHRRPQVQQALNEIREKGRAAAMYDLVAAVKEIDRAIAFSYARSHPTALAKLLELKAKLYGLVTEKHEVITVDLTKALNDAQARVLRRDLHQPIALNNGEDDAREY